MAYDKFTNLQSSAVPMPLENVDTDQIIPARFLKATERKGFGDNLFRDWRYNSDDSPKADFVLNNPTYSGKILVAGRNFGSGSRCVVSSFFADIFKNNSINVGLLPVQVTPEFLDKIFQAIEQNADAQLEVSLPDQTITILATGEQESFAINGYKKNNLMNGYDDIDYLRAMKEEIGAYAKKSLY